MVERWADWASEIVETWPDDITTADPDRQLLESQAAVTRARAREA